MIQDTTSEETTHEIYGTVSQAYFALHETLLKVQDF